MIVEREGKEMMLRPRQLVLATGMSGKPNMPEIPGHGDASRASSTIPVSHPGSGGYGGKKVRRDRLEQFGPRHLRRVVGARRGRHDDPALVDPHRAIGTLMELALGGLYSETAVAGGITTTKADLIFASIPYRIMPPVPDPGLRRDPPSAMPPSMSGWRRPASCSTSATTAPGCS